MERHLSSSATAMIWAVSTMRETGTPPLQLDSYINLMLNLNLNDAGICSMHVSPRALHGVTETSSTPTVALKRRYLVQGTETHEATQLEASSQNGRQRLAEYNDTVSGCKSARCATSRKRLAQRRTSTRQMAKWNWLLPTYWDPLYQQQGEGTVTSAGY